MRANNRIMEELGISILASTLSSLPTKKTTSKRGGSGTQGKSSGNNANQGEGLDLSNYIIEVEELGDGDDHTDLEEEAAPIANEVHFLDWLRGRDAGLHIFAEVSRMKFLVELLRWGHNFLILGVKLESIGDRLFFLPIHI